jgi:hypothetical protein
MVYLQGMSKPLRADRSHPLSRLINGVNLGPSILKTTFVVYITVLTIFALVMFPTKETPWTRVSPLALTTCLGSGQEERTPCERKPANSFDELRVADNRGNKPQAAPPLRVVSVTWENITLSKNDSWPFATISNAGHMKAQKKQGVVLSKSGDRDGFMLNGTFISVRGPVARSPVRVSVGVLSTKGSLQAREAIRSTWKTFPGNWSLTFILALPYDEELAKENKTHGDMMLASIKDQYGRVESALPGKIAAFYWWSYHSQYVPDWVFKTDDDSFLNVPRLFSILDNCLPDASTGVFAGTVFRSARVIRPGQHGFDKWGLTVKEWPDNKYPPYCSGAGYLLSSNIIPCFFRNLHVAERMPLEDVFTGLLASTCKVDPIHLCGIKHTPNERNVAYSTQLLVHYVRDTMIDVWKSLSKSTASTSCECLHVNKPPLSVYVISLQGVTGADPRNEGRLDDFSQSWRERCGFSTQIRVCPGEVHPRRGYGLTQTYVKCFQQAIHDGDDYSIFVEDDARLHTSEFCDSVYRDSIWSESTSDVLLILLGAHAIKYGHPSQKRILPLTYSHGSYGFMVPRENLISLRDHFSSDLLRGNGPLSPDISWYDLASHVKKHIYMISPVVVKHMKGFSNTWNRSREEIQ